MDEFEIIPAPGEAPKLGKNALTVLQSRYLIKDRHGRCIETPAELFSRVTSLAAQAEAKYGGGQCGKSKQWHRRFYDFCRFAEVFCPNSPALMNANRPGGMLSACFVLPIEDSIEGIFEAIKQTALIQKAGGGTGFSFDKLRPTGDRIASSGGTTSGPISFWRVFSETTDAIQQGAFRRGANMGMMSVEHPDILKFLHAKQNLKAFTNFNISVKITDDWMKKLDRSGGSLHIVKNPRTQQRYLLPQEIDIEYYTITDLHKLAGKSRPASGQRRRFYTVSDIWKMLINCAHRTGEPGVVFIDRINRANPTPSLGEIEATNPCGEQPLLPYEACTLGSINLRKFITFADGKADMDWPGLARAVKIGREIFWTILSICLISPSEILSGWRRLIAKSGWVLWAFADCLFALGIPYDSEQGIEFGGTLMSFYQRGVRARPATLLPICVGRFRIGMTVSGEPRETEKVSTMLPLRA